MSFNDELEFEAELIKLLKTKGWEDKVISHPTEKDLINNWAQILFDNNRDRDRLNDYPLTDGEMAQIIEQINTLKTPLKLNDFINGKTVSIKRDNPDDKEHFGKEVSLKIYDRQEIAAGQSRYQIVEQPIFSAQNPILNSRRGDLMLLINGMPVIHIELKKSGISVSEAYIQIEKYSYEGIFTGLFSLVQIFVAMTPEETVYFANAGTGNKFNRDFYFHWADFNNEPINNYKDIATSFLSIPMAHQLIGFYTVPDDLDGVLKVMRSYQYYAANAISDKVSKIDWNGKDLKGGYIWHTTGSGKTMTSFKSAQLISTSKDADKVVFLMDRIELGTQSLIEYRGFADAGQSIQDTESTYELIGKLKSSNPSDTLIVTSIQKMSRIKEDSECKLNQADLDIINKKRIVFIVDECHRTTFGEMMMTIKDTFKRAIFFGFTGTPIFDENEKHDNTTYTVFGDELHRYSIADGIRDKNVLGFDTYKVLTFKDKDVRKAVALDQLNATSEEEVLADETKRVKYFKFMNEMKMAGTFVSLNDNKTDEKYVKGIEDYVPSSQYRTIEHQNEVVNDILDNWNNISRGRQFSAIFATSSIPEAIEYYNKFMDLKNEGKHNLKITALFDPNIDNKDGFEFKEDGLVRLITDYNNLYGQNYTLPTFDRMKKDISLRLAKKKPYNRISDKEQIDLLIVVDQMLTGFDSKWVNTLYLDKVLRYESIIQAFSRTNRIFGDAKPFGIIKYYRKPHTMELNIQRAVKLYSGDKPFGLFVDKLEDNLRNLNEIYKKIDDVYRNADIENFEKLPESKEEKEEFKKLFKEFRYKLESAMIQNFKWEDEQDNKYEEKLDFGEQEFKILNARFNELEKNPPGEKTIKPDSLPYNLDGFTTIIDAETIDSNYMNKMFEKYLKALKQEGISDEELENILNELHKSYASLDQNEQKYAKVFIHDIQNGNIQIEEGKTFRDYIFEYIKNAENDFIRKVSNAFGVNEEKIRNIMSLSINESNINQFGRFDEIIHTADVFKAQNYLQDRLCKEVSIFEVNLLIDTVLREFILSGGFNLDEYNFNE